MTISTRMAVELLGWLEYRLSEDNEGTIERHHILSALSQATALAVATLTPEMTDADAASTAGEAVRCSMPEARRQVAAANAEYRMRQ